MRLCVKGIGFLRRREEVIKIFLKCCKNFCRKEECRKEEGKQETKIK